VLKLEVLADALFNSGAAQARDLRGEPPRLGKPTNCGFAAVYRQFGTRKSLTAVLAVTSRRS